MTEESPHPPPVILALLPEPSMEAIRPFLGADGEVLGSYRREADRYVLLVQEHPLTLPIFADLLAIAAIDFRWNHGDSRETLVTVGSSEGGVAITTSADRADLAAHVPEVVALLQRGMATFMKTHHVSRELVRKLLRGASKARNVPLNLDNSYAAMQLAFLRSATLTSFSFVEVKVDARVLAMTDHQFLTWLRQYVDAAYRGTR